MKRISLALFALLCLVSAGFSVETTFFENLGFSPDGRYFLFGQYGSQKSTKQPFAQLYFINVDKNVYHPGGAFSRNYESSLEVGEDGKSALYALLATRPVDDLRQKLKINHLATGRQIYQVYDEEGKPKDFGRKEIAFQDFAKGENYRVTLRQGVEKTAKVVQSSFFINTQLLKEDGMILKNITVGHPKYNRANVINYRVAQVYITPGERDLLFVVERENTRPDGTIFYDYMIEIGKLR